MGTHCPLIFNSFYLCCLLKFLANSIMMPPTSKQHPHNSYNVNRSSFCKSITPMATTQSEPDWYNLSLAVQFHIPVTTPYVANTSQRRCNSALTQSNTPTWDRSTSKEPHYCCHPLTFPTQNVQMHQAPHQHAAYSTVAQTQTASKQQRWEDTHRC